MIISTLGGRRSGTGGEACTGGAFKIAVKHFLNLDGGIVDVEGLGNFMSIVEDVVRRAGVVVADVDGEDDASGCNFPNVEVVDVADSLNRAHFIPESIDIHIRWSSLQEDHHGTLKHGERRHQDNHRKYQRTDGIRNL